MQTNTIMVWCTCGLSDQQHGKGRNFALDAWVVEHCRWVKACLGGRGGGGGGGEVLDAWLMDGALQVGAWATEASGTFRSKR